MSADLSIRIPQLLAIGNSCYLSEVGIPNRKGTDQRRHVVIVEHCEVPSQTGISTGTMVWLDNEKVHEDGNRERAAIRETLPDWVVVYSGPALNPEDISSAFPANHIGVWVERDSVQVDHE